MLVILSGCALISEPSQIGSDGSTDSSATSASSAVEFGATHPKIASFSALEDYLNDYSDLTTPEFDKNTALHNQFAKDSLNRQDFATSSQKLSEIVNANFRDYHLGFYRQLYQLEVDLAQDSAALSGKTKTFSGCDEGALDLSGISGPTQPKFSLYQAPQAAVYPLF